MRFVEGDDEGLWVTWFWCAPGAQPGPYTIFASGNWSSDPIWPWLGPGEIKGAPRPWYDGANPWGLKGDHFEGTAKEFAEGLPAPPDPKEFTWGCNQYPSNPCVCFMRRPAEEVPVVLPSLQAAFTPIRFPLVWQSDVCVCLNPSHQLGPVQPVAYGYGSTPTPVPAVVSTPCLCFEPGAVVHQLGPVAYGYRSAPTAALPVLSTPCLCFEPGAVVHQVGPVAYGYGSAATAALPVVSNPCICFEPRSQTGVAPSGPYASGGSSVPIRFGPNLCCSVTATRVFLDITLTCTGSDNAKLPMDFDGVRYFFSPPWKPSSACPGASFIFRLWNNTAALNPHCELDYSCDNGASWHEIEFLDTSVCVPFEMDYGITGVDTSCGCGGNCVWSGFVTLT